MKTARPVEENGISLSTLATKVVCLDFHPFNKSTTLPSQTFKVCSDKNLQPCNLLSFGPNPRLTSPGGFFTQEVSRFLLVRFFLASSVVLGN